MDTTTDSAELAGVVIAYRDHRPAGYTENEHSPVVLVHGMGGDSGTWDRLVRDLLAHDRRVVTVDLRGHGRSAHAASYEFDSFAGDVMALLDHLNLGVVDLVGHSLGGYAVSVVAQRRPASVRRLVLEEMPIPIRPGDAPPKLTGRVPSITELWHAGTSIVRHPRAVISFDRSMTKTALEQFRRPNDTWWTSLSHITAPTLVLRGGPGGMVDPVRLSAMADEIPDCRVVVCRTGHSIHRDGYPEFEAAVLPFLLDRDRAH